MITKSTMQQVPWISETDPAIDKESSRYDRVLFERTGDVKHLPLKEGARASVFQVKRLSRRQHFHVMSLPVMLAVQEAVAYGLVSLEPAGVDLERKQGELGQRLNEQSLDALFELGPQVLIDLGTFIIGMARPDPT